MRQTVAQKGWCSHALQSLRLPGSGRPTATTCRVSASTTTWRLWSTGRSSTARPPCGPDYIRGKGSSVINNSSRTARVYQKDNYFGRHVCVGADGGTIADLRSYQLNDTTHSLKNNTTPCGA